MKQCNLKQETYLLISMEIICLDFGKIEMLGFRSLLYLVKLNQAGNTPEHFPRTKANAQILEKHFIKFSMFYV